MWIKLRIWWWKKRYSWRIWECAIGPEGQALDRTFCDAAAKAGWEASLYWHEGNVEQALQDNPEHEADDEMENWTDDEEAA